MTDSEAQAEMLAGYRDGLNRDAPPPGPNRSHSYRHGYANGVADRKRRPRAHAAWLRAEAERCINYDIGAC